MRFFGAGADLDVLLFGGWGAVVAVLFVGGWGYNAKYAAGGCDQTEYNHLEQIKGKGSFGGGFIDKE